MAPPPRAPSPSSVHAGAPTLQVQSFDFADVDALNRSSQYVRYSNPAPSRQLEVEITVVQLGSVVVDLLRGSPFSVERTQRDVDTDTHHMLDIGVLRSGTSRLAQDGRREVFGAGEASFVRTDAPFLYRSQDRTDLILLHVALAALGPVTAQLPRLTSRMLPPTPAVTTLITLLRDLGDSPPDPAGAGAVYLGHALLELARAAVSELQERVPTAPPIDVDLYDRARHVVLANLTDPGLDPAFVAARLNIGVRSVHRRFAARGTTVAAFIRTSRLDAAAGALVAPPPHRTTTGAVAERYGFGSAGAFTRAFRARFGVTPSAYRSARAVPHPVSAAR